MKLFTPKTRVLLERRFTPIGIEYLFTGENRPNFPLNSNQSTVLSPLLPQGELWSALDYLWTEGLVELVGEKRFRIPYRIYDVLEENEGQDYYEILRLPEPASFETEVNSTSNIGSPDFRVHVESFHPEYGPLREGDPVRSDRVFIISENRIVPLTREQADLFNTARGDDTDWNNINDRMRYLAAIKSASLNADAVVDHYIKSEDYAFITEAGLDVVEHNADEIQIIPKIEGLNQFDIKDTDLIEGEVPSVLSKTVEGFGRKRIVFAKTLKEKLGRLPEGGKIIGQNVPRLLTQPESIIPEGFDLSLFSERVKGIRTRVYNSRPYIHIQKSKEGWFEGIPGIQLDDWSPASDERPVIDSQPNNLSEETYRKLAEQAKESGQEYVLHNGNWVRIDPQISEKFDQVLGQFETVNNTYRIPAGSILEIYENLDLLEFIDKQSLAQNDDQLPDDLPSIEMPATFLGELYPYQFDGYRWLFRLSKYLQGGLLADEMGLGKTVQVIAHFLKLKAENAGSPHLVVVPKTLLENWDREIRQFSGGELAVYLCDSASCRFDNAYLEKFDVVLITYDALRRNQAQLGTIDWNMVVCDEAQNAKNPTTQRTCAVKALKSKHRAALSGTPVENGLIEFWCIMDFVQPGLLGSWSDFRREYERPIVEGGEADRDEKIKLLLTQLKGYYLRRLKENTLDLPEKKAIFCEVALTEKQLEAYRGIAAQAKSGGRGTMLAGIQKLLMFCALPESVGYIMEEGVCPKMVMTLEMLKEIEGQGEKAIIFTNYKKIQCALQSEIRRAFGIWPDIINGDLTNHRQRVVDIFSEKPGFNVMILGHQVAGVGLNITAANHVIHYTRPWNPAKENQATDRTHRIGQEKQVYVYYPIVKDSRFKTVEERLHELIASKEKLAHDVLRPTAEREVKAEELFDCLDAVVG